MRVNANALSCRGHGLTHCLLLVFFMAVPVHAELGEAEREILSWIDGSVEQMEQLIEQTVNINSGTMNFDGIRQVGNVLADEFEEIGLETEWIDMLSVDRSGHLFARTRFERGVEDIGPKILLIGHLDTVFGVDDVFQTFVRSPDGLGASGPGIIDMKAGNVVLIYALKALAHVGALDQVNAVAAIMGDEENPGMPLDTSREQLRAAGEWADYALGFEPGLYENGAFRPTTARRGASRWTLEVSGNQAHSSQIFTTSVGAGAIFEASRILSDFYDEVRGEQYLTFNAGNILGGTEVAYDTRLSAGEASGRTNVVPRHVVVNGGLRTLTTEQLQQAKESMRRIVERNLPGTEATITFEDLYPPMSPTSGNARLLEIVSVINQDMGGDSLQPLDPGRRGAADISFVAESTDSLGGLGVNGTGGHSPDEFMDLSSLPDAVKRAALLIYRLSRAAD